MENEKYMKSPAVSLLSNPVLSKTESSKCTDPVGVEPSPPLAVMCCSEALQTWTEKVDSLIVFTMTVPVVDVST